MSMRAGSTEGGPVDDYRPRVLVVDDSAPLRGAIAQFLEAGGCDVVGRAMDGAVALQLVEETNPDVITCDLEMPRMDGFTFLRILTKLRSTPVIVITSDARPEAALTALELGARDFVVKPARPSELGRLQHQLIQRIRGLVMPLRQPRPTWKTGPQPLMPSARSLVVIGASTGGPKALRDIFSQVKSPPKMPVLIAQHMPPRFTEAFADRLRKASDLDVKEAVHGEVVQPGQVRVAPGGKHLRVEGFVGAAVRVSTMEPQPNDRWVPSVDVLMASAAAFAREKLLGVVLTGMGKDGSDGAKALKDAGAPLWTESPLTAAIDGMPQSAAVAHGSAQVIALDELAVQLAKVLDGEGR
ncbi:MAG: chemotaxis-specific protein-glutamate methyltransferase CheB [Deltaproteobacteria bacterium]|nr:chemotaxis-specific protein-glutamate methyltransferase CheB [Deltaproteobacteria bacterium]